MKPVPTITLRYLPLVSVLLDAGVVTPTSQPMPWVMRGHYAPECFVVTRAWMEQMGHIRG
jgi:hypothetical protein